MSPLTPISAGGRFGQKTLTIDKYKRLMFSSSLRQELRLTTGLDYVVLAIDPEHKRIGVVRQDLARVKNVDAFKVDKKGYTSARRIIEKLALEGAAYPIRFVDGGFEDSDGIRYRLFELDTKESR